MTMHFYPVTITGIDNNFKCTAESATLSGTTLTAFATSSPLPHPPGKYNIQGPGSIPNLNASLEYAYPAMAIFNHVSAA
ncbi:hypothetical protein [Niveispirillum sp. BGYR6]|uniref:hypothetical protein n=1 Tax=Niveispirillum sp. BGYR6 TaxID=2971249 RepID=UPI0022B98B99|nr:hypothetical protein [Niveispirillum sp. BGYR6]MDG5493649.1 hypothetical protein [Niveispirillum sp. BGYR6]